MTNPMLNPQHVRETLRNLDVRPTRGMGQNFLIDRDALQTIVSAAHLTQSSVVVEVGPGLGVLTWELVQVAGSVTAIELDTRLANRLERVYAESSNLTLVNQDVLQTDIAALTQHKPYQVVANLPYAITSPVLRHFLESANPPTSMVVLVQREVAQRICAQPGDMSVLAHGIQVRAIPELIAVVPPESFLPAPEVHSAVMRLTLRDKPLIEPEREARVFRILKAGFLHARKQLGNSLSGGLAAHGIKIERSDAQAALVAAGIDPARRAETLSFAEWIVVTEKLVIRN
jgi:16S rRNA (adenine1518-N6/adenine1519-N6)-dimethyltransferase